MLESKSYHFAVRTNVRCNKVVAGRTICGNYWMDQLKNKVLAKDNLQYAAPTTSPASRPKEIICFCATFLSGRAQGHEQLVVALTARAMERMTDVTPSFMILGE
jgi:hypothetical protein